MDDEILFRGDLAVERTATPGRHPFCTEAYARALASDGVEVHFVEEWDTHVLVRETPRSGRRAAGVRPLAPLVPGCDLRGGLEALRAEGVASVVLATDPMFVPELASLEAAFDTCQVLRENYVIDRQIGEVHFRKRHRNRVNGARRRAEIRTVLLADHLDEWLTMYEANVESRAIMQPFEASYFERLSGMGFLQAVGAFMGDELVSMSMWVRHGDVLFFHDGASSERGFAISAAYATFAQAIEEAGDCRFVFLGGSGSMPDDRLDGLAIFKRGFANMAVMNHLCTVALRRSPRGDS